MKTLSLLSLVLIMAGCAAPATMNEKPAPQSTERSDRAHEGLDKEMSK